jgi:hypothetical protein
MSGLLPQLLEFARDNTRATYRVPLLWNDAALEAIRRSRSGSTIAARALALVQTCIYDAWSVYDPVARSTSSGTQCKQPPTQQTQVNKERAISYAAYRTLVALFPRQQSFFDTQMQQLGYDPGDTTIDSHALAGSGNLITNAVPFALQNNAHLRPALPPATSNEPRYAAQANTLLNLSAYLTDRQKIISEYWMNSPGSIQLPGRWCMIAQYMIKRDRYDLDNAVKLLFMLANGLLDASIACWDTKFTYSSERPINAIRYLYAGRKVQAWAGPYQGTQIIDGERWLPYQLPEVITPASPEYCSAHSTFSTTSAILLGLYSRNDYFGASYTFHKGCSNIEPGLTPHEDITLYWERFSDAADEASISCCYGGIHFELGDLVGRALGRRVAALVWKKAQEHFGQRQAQPLHNIMRVSAREEGNRVRGGRCRADGLVLRRRYAPGIRR